MNAVSSFDKAIETYARPSPAFPRFLSAARTYWRAMQDGLGAARAYHELIAKGETHEAAIAKVFEQHFRGR